MAGGAKGAQYSLEPQTAPTRQAAGRKRSDDRDAGFTRNTSGGDAISTFVTFVSVSQDQPGHRLPETPGDRRITKLWIGASSLLPGLHLCANLIAKAVTKKLPGTTDLAASAVAAFASALSEIDLTPLSPEDQLGCQASQGGQALRLYWYNFVWRTHIGVTWFGDVRFHDLPELVLPSSLLVNEVELDFDASVADVDDFVVGEYVRAVLDEKGEVLRVGPASFEGPASID